MPPLSVYTASAHHPITPTGRFAEFKMSEANAGYFRSRLPYNRFGHGPRTLVIFQGLMFENKPQSGLALGMHNFLREDYTAYSVLRRHPERQADPVPGDGPPGIGEAVRAWCARVSAAVHIPLGRRNDQLEEAEHEPATISRL
jgi:hypothetical protein